MIIFMYTDISITHEVYIYILKSEENILQECSTRQELTSGGIKKPTCFLPSKNKQTINIVDSFNVLCTFSCTYLSSYLTNVSILNPFVFSFLD